MPGYQGWQWAVVVAACPGATHATISEVVLVLVPRRCGPAVGALGTAGQPGDLGPGDLPARYRDEIRDCLRVCRDRRPPDRRHSRRTELGRRVPCAWLRHGRPALAMTATNTANVAAMVRATKRVCRDCGISWFRCPGRWGQVRGANELSAGR